MTVYEKIDGVVSELGKIGIVPVIKLENTDDAVALAGALRAGGINCAEVTYRAAGADKVIAAMCSAFPDMIVGAGTVLTCEQADKAYAAGARFCVAPGLNPEVVRHCLDAGIPFAPGVSNASEVEQAMGLGLSFVKFFPAEQAGGAAYIKSLSAPYAGMRFMPTGGVTADNLNSYLTLGNVPCCGGSWIVPAKLLEAGDWEGVTALCREAVDRMLGLTLAHVGINAPDASAAEAVADKFEAAFGKRKKVGNSSVFAGTEVEVMKTPGRGAMGHIGFSTNSVDRAVYQLERRGFAVDLSSVKCDAKGRMTVAYLSDGDFGGFAVHLLQKK